MSVWRERSIGRRRVLVALTLVAVSGSVAADAQANGGAKHDFRVFPKVGALTTTFRVTFTAPYRTDGVNSDYTLEGIGPRRCPILFDFTFAPTRRGERVVMRLTASDDLYLTSRQRWCPGSYVGAVYWTNPDLDKPDRFVGYFSFGVGRFPVSLEG